MIRHRREGKQKRPDPPLIPQAPPARVGLRDRAPVRQARGEQAHRLRNGEVMVSPLSTRGATTGTHLGGFQVTDQLTGYT